MIVDILVLSVILISAIISFLRGFIREILTILGIGGGIIAAYIGGPMFIPTVYGWLGIDPNAEEPQKLMDMVPMTLVGDVLAYGGLFIVFVIVLSIISHFIAEGAKNIGLGALDRTLGVVFGLVRGVLLLGLFYLPVYYFVEDEKKQEWFAESKSFVYLETTSEVIAGFIPKDTEEKIQQATEDMKDSTVQEKLESMDVLKKNENSDDDKNLEKNDQTTQETPKDPDGYTEEFRNNITDKIIELNNTAPEAGGYND